MEIVPPSEAFPYLGRMIAYNNSDWAEVYLNLRKSWRRWGMVARVIKRTGAIVRARRSVYKAVAYLVLLYGNKSCVVTGDMLEVLAGFHHWVAQ